MNTLIERMMYMTLLVVFLGLALGLYATVSLAQKLDRELQAVKQVNQSQQEVLNRIDSSTKDIEANSRQNTEYLKCLINLQRYGSQVTADDCSAVRPPNVAGSSTVSPQVSRSAPAATPTRSNTTSPQSKPSQPSTSPQNPVLNLLKSITGISL